MPITCRKIVARGFVREVIDDIIGNSFNNRHVQTMSVSQFHVMQIMLSSQDGGAETFFDKLCLALVEAGVLHAAV